MYTFFRYSGSKQKYARLISKMIRTGKKVYCEPFAGSGGVLFNLPNSMFDRYVVNDIDRNITQMYSAFKRTTYSEYLNFRKDLEAEFGQFASSRTVSLDEAKENYYTFRNWFNAHVWQSGDKLEGLCLHVLACSCINSFLRFGPEGMNQSFGDRDMIIGREDFSKISEVLSKSEIVCEDYRNLLSQDAFYFLDPPYASQDSSYSGFSDSDQAEFVENIDGLEFLYTDILTEHNKRLNRYKLREMRSTSPNANKQVRNGNVEYLFSSYPFSSVGLGLGLC